MWFTRTSYMTLIRSTLLIFSLSLLSAASLANDYNVIVSEDGLVSMYGRNIAVVDIMNSLGTELNIAISFPTPVPDRVSVDFQELKLEQAIKQVTQSYILVTSKKTGNSAIKEIIVMPEGEASAYLPEEGDVQQLLVQEGAELEAQAVESRDQQTNRMKMLERIAKIKSRTQVDVDEPRLSTEIEEQMGDMPPPDEGH